MKLQDYLSRLMREGSKYGDPEVYHQSSDGSLRKINDVMSKKLTDGSTILLVRATK